MIRLRLLRLAGFLAVGISVAAPTIGLAQQTRSAEQASGVAAALNRAMRTAIGAPDHVALGPQATLQVPDDMLFIPRPAADDMVTALGKPVPADYQGLIFNQAGGDWFGVLQAVTRGHVDVDEIRNWTANDIIASVRDSVERDNEQRIQRGDWPREVRRWVQAPTLDAAQHRLSWCLLILPKDSRRDAGGEVTCYVAAFSRAGYVRLALTTALDILRRQQAVPDTILTNIAFQPEQAFTDFKPGRDAADPAGLAGVFGIEHLRKADLKTRLRTFGEPLVIPGSIALFVLLLAGIGAALYRWHRLRNAWPPGGA